jgi:hypothetical protein
MITTQQLFDGILTHIRVQGGHGTSTGYNTERSDGCRCVKGIWMSEEALSSLKGTHEWWLSPKKVYSAIEGNIKRELTQAEVIMFDILEKAYERPSNSIWGHYDSSLPKAEYRYMPEAFESTAKLVAKKLKLRYTEPNQLPLQEPLEIKEINPYLAKKVKLYLLKKAHV